MKRVFSAAIAATILAIPAMAEPIAPNDVTFEDGAIAASLTGTPGNPEEGAKVISDKGIGNCVSCHVVSAMPDVPWQGNVGPALDGVADRWSEAEIRGIVANAKLTYDGTIMPSFYKVGDFIRPGIGFTSKPLAPEDVTPLLTAQQIEDVVAYLVTLKE